MTDIPLNPSPPLARVLGISPHWTSRTLGHLSFLPVVVDEYGPTETPSRSADFFLFPLLLPRERRSAVFPFDLILLH